MTRQSTVLVEGASDKAALEALACLSGRDLAREGIVVIALDGATNFRSYLERLGPRGENRVLAGLCDEAEEPVLRAALESAGMGTVTTRPQLEEMGFFVCVADLEDELLRALGNERALSLIEGEGDGGSWRLFSSQPAQLERSVEARLRRFMGTKSGRKAKYARAMVEALGPERQPTPLRRLLATVLAD